MKMLYALLAVTVLAMFGCSGAGVRAISPDDSAAADTALALKVENESVALMAPNGAHLAAVCGGVWTAPTCFLSAAHCIDQDVLDQDFMFTVREVFIKKGPDAYATARVVAHDMSTDLMMLQLTMKPHELYGHPVAALSQSALADGTPLVSVAQYSAYPWSFRKASVSAHRLNEPNGIDVNMDTLQIQMISPNGSSGIGVFDTNGDLAGIISYMDSRASADGFAVHRDAIRKFLAEHPCDPKGPPPMTPKGPPVIEEMPDPVELLPNEHR